MRAQPRKPPHFADLLAILLTNVECPTLLTDTEQIMPDCLTDDEMKWYRDRYPPLITFIQAAEIAQRPLATIYDWSSRGHFDRFKKRQGRECRLLLAAFLNHITLSADSSAAA